jgi:hypothetical protein
MILAATTMCACDRTHPDVKLLTDTRESITPLAVDANTLAAHAITRELREPADTHDALWITPEVTVLELGDYVQDATALQAIQAFEPDQDTPRRAFTIPNTNPGARLAMLSGLERKMHTTELIITPDSRLEATRLAAISQHATAAGWGSYYVKLSPTRLLPITPSSMCPEPEQAPQPSFVKRCDHCEVSAHMAHDGACEAVTLHWLPDGTWRGSLRHVSDVGDTCVSVPARQTSGAYDELDTITCAQADGPDELLDALAAKRSLCDVVAVNPLGGHTTGELMSALGVMSTHRAARQMTLVHLPAPAQPVGCP